MKPNLILVKKEEKEILRKLIREYQQELLKIEEPEEYKYLDSYWEKENRFPYFIKVDKNIIGFALVNDYNLVNKGGKNIAEFYIKKEFRKNGIGKITAMKIFDLFHGKWEIRELRDNIDGQNFWRKVINDYTKGNFKEILLDDNNWQGPVQIFENKLEG